MGSSTVLLLALLVGCSGFGVKTACPESFTVFIQATSVASEELTSLSNAEGAFGCPRNSGGKCGEDEATFFSEVAAFLGISAEDVRGKLETYLKTRLEVQEIDWLSNEPSAEDDANPLEVTQFYIPTRGNGETWAGVSKTTSGDSSGVWGRNFVLEGIYFFTLGYVEFTGIELIRDDKGNIVDVVWLWNNMGLWMQRVSDGAFGHQVAYDLGVKTEADEDEMTKTIDYLSRFQEWGGNVEPNGKGPQAL